MKRETEQASFASGSEASDSPDIEKRGCGASAVALNDLDSSDLLDDKKPVGVVVRLLNVERR